MTCVPIGCGHEGIVRAKEQLIRKALEPRLGKAIEFEEWHRGEPLDKAAARAPSATSLQIVNWWGSRGGHMGFSPVMPPGGALARKTFRAMKARFEEHGLDWCCQSNANWSPLGVAGAGGGCTLGNKILPLGQGG